MSISHLPDIERIFEVSVNVHSLQEDGHTDVIYLSRLKFPVMHLIYVGGKYKKDLSLFQRLENAGYFVPKEDRFYHLISSFDMEAFQIKRNEKLQGRTVLYKHVPASFSVHSNIDGHTTPQHRQSNGDPQKLIDELISVLLLQQESASRIMHEKFREIFPRLNDDIQETKKKAEPLLGRKKTQVQMKL